LFYAKNIDKLKKNKIFIQILDNILFGIGTFLVALVIDIFLLPNKISSGGASGVGIILNYLFKIPIGITILLLNLPLFVIAIKKLGIGFSIRSIIGTVMLTIFIEIISYGINMFNINMGNDLVLASVFGGIILGFGLSLVFKANGSTGGSDLLAQILYKYRPGSSMGQIMLIIDSLVIISTMIVFKSINSGLYSLILVFFSKRTVEILFDGVDYTKIVNIISKNSEVISKRIILEVERGVTKIDCIGEYTKEEYQKLECVVTLPQIAKIKRIVKEEDEGAFIYISKTSEVLGHGFEKARTKRK